MNEDGLGWQLCMARRWWIHGIPKDWVYGTWFAQKKPPILSIPKNGSQSNPHRGYAVTLTFYVPIAPSHAQASSSAFAFFSLTPRVSAYSKLTQEPTNPGTPVTCAPVTVISFHHLASTVIPACAATCDPTKHVDKSAHEFCNPRHPFS